MTDDLSEWVIQSEPRGRAGEGEMEWFAGDMRAESGRLNLEGAIIKNLFASFYPPLPSWQSRLPLTIKDLITICKKKEDGMREMKVCHSRYSEWKMILQRDISQKTLTLFISCPLTSNGKLLLLPSVLCWSILTYRYEWYQTCPISDYHNNGQHFIRKTDSDVCHWAGYLFLEDIHAFYTYYYWFTSNSWENFGKKSLIYCCCVAIVWKKHKKKTFS